MNSCPWSLRPKASPAEGSWPAGWPGHALATARVRRARRSDQTVPAVDPQHARPPPRQRPIRSHQHPPAPAHPPRLWLPQRRGTDRHGLPHLRRTLPTTPRRSRESTHGNGRRSSLSTLWCTLHLCVGRNQKQGPRRHGQTPGSSPLHDGQPAASEPANRLAAAAPSGPARQRIRVAPPPMREVVNRSAAITVTLNDCG